MQVPKCAPPVVDRLGWIGDQSRDPTTRPVCPVAVRVLVVIQDRGHVVHVPAEQLHAELAHDSDRYGHKRVVPEVQRHLQHTRTRDQGRKRADSHVIRHGGALSVAYMGGHVWTTAPSHTRGYRCHHYCPSHRDSRPAPRQPDRHIQVRSFRRRARRWGRRRQRAYPAARDPWRGTAPPASRARAQTPARAA